MSTESLRIMTFNTWNTGRNFEDGLHKLARHIALVNPDAVGLQEIMTPGNFSTLTQMLGPSWTGIYKDDHYPDSAILTRHKFQTNSTFQTEWCIAAKIELTNSQESISMANCHLDYTSYGPYAAYNKMVTKLDQIMAGEFSGRAQGIYELIQHDKMKLWIKKSNLTPLIVTGDFNAPSHLDWTDDEKKTHGDWKVAWPSSKAMEDAGYTWSTVNKFNPDWNYTIPEPMDRIDFIFSQGRIKPAVSTRYAGTEPLKRIPYHQQNDYPSDHYAVVSDFRFL
ncbi:hypothetical protein WR25_05848 [Diploscapter pachys]|uniref:Endonuclease/exonuclease/phosphatase domain-containing protein n=1 Tax=Diploscapter pachys TaxID=2018661 RepID=A0A2A2L721_9BILA|nr:hypothetical protein WR25_05848 [Diploscapter pachys]